MTTSELVNVTMAIVDAHGLDQAARLKFFAELTARIYQPSNEPARPPIAQPASAPAPQPAAMQPGGAVWIPAGGQCKCSTCKKFVYRVIKDVPERVTNEMFRSSFEPLGGAPELPEEPSIYGDPHGNLAIDCPLCKGTKSLWIRGEGSYDEVPDGAV